MVCLSHEEFVKLLDNTTEYWRPLLEFLVASGARWGEATALRPCDVDRAHGTVRIIRAWKPIQGGYELGPPKTKRSVRTIDIPQLGARQARLLRRVPVHQSGRSPGALQRISQSRVAPCCGPCRA